MANRQDRYRALYQRMVRPNNASTFPRHNFIRSANTRQNEHDRLGNREDCFKTTLVHLTERFNGKDVYLVGTMNQSTMLAQRTQKLIQEVKPDTVIVQAEQDWWTKAKLLQYVNSQDEMRHYDSMLDKLSVNRWADIYWASRKFISLARLYMYQQLYQWHFGFSKDYDFMRPGLEVKLACEAAEQTGAQIHFAGNEIDDKTWQRLNHETRYNVPQYLLRTSWYNGTMWNYENETNKQKLSMAGPTAFSEQCCDQHLINWYTQCTDVFFPQLKRIFVDMKDEDLFEQVDKAPGQKVVVLVNQWHLEGIEHHWCHRYGQLPRSVEFKDGINPIGDMNLRAGLWQRMYNYLHREIASSNVKATPSTYADWIIGYHRESNWQYEHRDM